MMFLNLRNIYVLNINRADYHCIINGISKNEAIKLMKNVDLTEKSRTLWNMKNVLSHIKIVKEITTFGDINVEKQISLL